MWIKHWKVIRAQKNVHKGDKDTEDSSTKTGMDRNVPDRAYARGQNWKKCFLCEDVWSTRATYCNSEWRLQISVAPGMCEGLFALVLYFEGLLGK